MYEIFTAGGPIMVPLLLCSVIALGIIIERFWMLKSSRVLPANLPSQIWSWLKNNELDEERIQFVHLSSPLGRVLAAGLNNRHRSREIMKESIEATGRQVALELERFLNTLGTITSISPLLGLLGTVLGMIVIFSAITDTGVGDPRELAGGISQALITTVAGLTVAIPSMIFHRYFKGRVEALITDMEQEALKLIDLINDQSRVGHR